MYFNELKKKSFARCKPSIKTKICELAESVKSLKFYSFDSINWKFRGICRPNFPYKYLNLFLSVLNCSLEEGMHTTHKLFHVVQRSPKNSTNSITFSHQTKQTFRTVGIALKENHPANVTLSNSCYVTGSTPVKAERPLVVVLTTKNTTLKDDHHNNRPTQQNFLVSSHSLDKLTITAHVVRIISEQRGLQQHHLRQHQRHQGKDIFVIRLI
jgi:hypothetical protein